MAKDYSYSRLNWAQERRLRRRTVILGILSIVIVIGFIFWGLPAIPRAISLINWGGSANTTFGVDTTPPPPPSIFAPTSATNSASFTLTGLAEPKSAVEVTLNGQVQPTVEASADGTFSVTLKKLFQGSNTAQAIAIDKAGNRSQPSSQVSITYDNSKPEITVDQPSDGQQFAGSKQQMLTVSGSLSKQASLTLNQRYVVVGSDNHFSTQLSLNTGGNTLTLIATDSAGNTTTKQLSVNYEP